MPKLEEYCVPSKDGGLMGIEASKRHFCIVTSILVLVLRDHPSMVREEKLSLVEPWMKNV